MTELLNALNDFFVTEYGDDAELDKLPEDGIINLAYSTWITSDGEEREIQIDFDLTNLKYLEYVDNILVNENATNYSIQEFIDEIKICTFENLISDCINNYQRRPCL